MDKRDKQVFMRIVAAGQLLVIPICILIGLLGL